VAEDLSASDYSFGCGHCHPVDLDDHLTHVRPYNEPDVVLDPASAPTATLRARNAALAAYDPGTRTCSGVYCHSSGQETPEYVTTVSWDAAPGSLGCDGCHGNPPRYPSGGAGTATANSHLGLDDYGWETGHFAGLPGPAHSAGPQHGGGSAYWGADASASPITCQACHFETVAAGPGRFFFFDPTGSYSFTSAERDSVDESRTSFASWQRTQCVTCHAGEARAGGVVPRRHVNGRRDVAFDPRPALPDDYVTGLPTLASAGPVRPNYLGLRAGSTISFALAPGTCATTQAPSCGVWQDVALRDAANGGNVVTFTLEHARYDPATRTCTSVACHLDRQVQVERGASALRWGGTYGYDETCSGCHSSY
jgi:predicted CxxxxCH...CXXCH cytochrome family protein